MSNPLFQMMGNQQGGNMMQMVAQFQQFRNTFRGDARQQVQNLLNSGKISQSQYNQAVQMANALQSMMKN